MAMTRGDVLLQAIHEAPDNDVPRLVYADWLRDPDPGGGQSGLFSKEERDANEVLGEFIQVQCELAKLPEGHPLTEERQTRELDLLRDHIDEWLPPAPADAHSRIVFSRGFPVVLGASYIPQLRSLRATNITIRGSRDPARALTTIAQHPDIAGRLTCLNLGPCTYADEDLGIALGRCEFRNLQCLNPGNSVVGCGVASVVVSTHFPKLRHLVFNGEDEVRWFLENVKFGGLLAGIGKHWMQAVETINGVAVNEVIGRYQNGCQTLLKDSTENAARRIGQRVQGNPRIADIPGTDLPG